MSIFICNIINYILPFFITKINIKIWHAYSFWI